MECLNNHKKAPNPCKVLGARQLYKKKQKRKQRMKKKSFIIKMVLFLMVLGSGMVMMTACSSDEEEELVDPALKPLVGYWQYTGTTYDSYVGYLFKASGEVIRWSLDMGADEREYKETHFGTSGIDAEQHFYIKGDNKEIGTDGILYPITEISSDYLTIYFPNSPELLQYQKYKKLQNRPE
jgi:hypothetical protein